MSKHTLIRTLSPTGIALTFCMILAAPGIAEARSNFPNFVPKSQQLGSDLGSPCSICHVSAGGGGTRKAFGLDVRANLSAAGTPDWSAIYDLDSDGDGFTNGEELCDPNGTWTRGSGDPDPSCEPTDPSDPSSKPMVMMGQDMGMPAEDMGMNPVDMGTEEDMATPGEDMGSTPVDMGGTPDQGGTGEADMGQPLPNNTPGVDMGTAGNNTSGADMGTSGGSDMGDAPTPVPEQEDEDDEGCAQSGLAGGPAGGTLSLLGLLGLLGLTRRRRA